MQTTYDPRNLDKSGERVRPMFAAIAPKYDRMNHVLSLNVDRYWRWWTVRKIAPNPRSKSPILDVCTGTGDLELAYHRATGGRIPIVATDFCSEMLEIARDKSRLSEGQIPEFREADTTRLPFASGRFQLVTVAFGLRNVADTDEGLREMVRVCEPGGRVAILEFSMPERQPFKGVYSWYFRNVLPRIGQWLARNDQAAYSYLPESVGQFPYGQRMADRLISHGLIDVNFYPLTFGVATLYVGTKPNNGN